MHTERSKITRLVSITRSCCIMRNVSILPLRLDRLQRSDWIKHNNIEFIFIFNIRIQYSVSKKILNKVMIWKQFQHILYILFIILNSINSSCTYYSILIYFISEALIVILNYFSAKWKWKLTAHPVYTEYNARNGNTIIRTGLSEC